MIFVTVGSQKFQFNRLLIEIDNLVESNVINEPVFAQIGENDYCPRHYEYTRFLDREVFEKKICESDVVITHGGTGVIIRAVKQGKKVIAVPRLAKYKEHVDDHQLQLLKQFDDLKLIIACYDIHNLGQEYVGLENRSFNSYNSNTQSIIDSIDMFLREIENDK